MLTLVFQINLSRQVSTAFDYLSKSILIFCERWIWAFKYQVTLIIISYSFNLLLRIYLSVQIKNITFENLGRF